MKNLQLLFLIIATSLTSSAQLVVQVYDGDTYKILDKGKFQIIRLANVDAPELSQYNGKVVKAAVSKLMLGKSVKLECYGKDRFGRTLANVSIDGKSLDSIHACGLAWHWLPYSHHKYLSTYESNAKAAKLGMWRCNKNVPPWTWRQFNKRQKRSHDMCR